MRDWGISHTTTSPHYPQANGMAEKFVQIVKRLLNKAKQDNQDPYMSLLIHRNTNIDNLASPAQMLMGRRLHTNLPVIPKQLDPRTVDPGKVNCRRRQRQVKQKQCHDRGSKALPALEQKEKMRMQVYKGDDICNSSQHGRHTSLLHRQNCKWEDIQKKQTSPDEMPSGR